MCEFSKECPSCGVLMCYSRKDTLKDSISKNRECKKCAKKDVIPSFIINGKVSSEVLEKTSKTWFKKGDRPKNADDRKGKTLIELYGEEKANKLLLNLQNRVHSEKSKEIRSMKSRFYMIERLKKLNKNFHPPYNPKACQYFNKIMNDTNSFIQHAENGGEFFIKELGFWVDGYDIENNIVYEYDEKHHFINNKLKDKDIKRQNLITELLKCKFIRIKD
jgi:hypothetical protein